MKISSLRRNGFTLIELLTVIAIIAILMGLLFAAINAAKNAARMAQARTDVKSIQAAVVAFQTDYGTYPIPPAMYTGADILFDSGNQRILMDILRDTATGAPIVNPKHVRYLDLNMVRNPARPAGGVSPATNMFYDPWGAPYFVSVDCNYDGTLTGAARPPYGDYPAGKPFPFSVVAFSYGKDGKIGKNGDGVLAGSDDVVSWQ